MNWLFIVSKMKEVPTATWGQLTAAAFTLVSAYFLQNKLANKEVRRLQRKALWQGIKSRFKRKKFNFGEGWGCLVSIILIALVIWGISVLVKYIVNMI